MAQRHPRVRRFSLLKATLLVFRFVHSPRLRASPSSALLQIIRPKNDPEVCVSF